MGELNGLEKCGKRAETRGIPEKGGSGESDMRCCAARMSLFVRRPEGCWDGPRLIGECRCRRLRVSAGRRLIGGSQQMHYLRRRRRGVGKVLVGLLVVVIAVAVVAVGLRDNWRSSEGDPSRPSRHASPELDSTAGPAVPAKGAYFGAWRKPQRLTDEGRLESIRALEEGIGRRLDIVHTYRTWEEPFFSPSDLEFVRRGYLLQLSWAGTDTRVITSGRYDAMIRERAVAARSLGKPFFMEWRWEMDRPNLQASIWSPLDFVAAWKHIKRIFDEEGVTNAAWVWCPTAPGFTENNAADFYPGDDFVDWTCVDAYPGPDYQPIAQVLEPFLAWAVRHPKPIMIGEFGASRGQGSARRAQWLAEAAETFRANPQIKAVVYFDSDPAGNRLPRQYALSDDPEALAAFAEIGADPWFNPQKLPVETR